MIPIGIVAHSTRIQAADDLANAVDAAHMAVDADHRDVWAEFADSTDPWACVLEDTAIPVDDFNQQLYDALDNAPTPIMSLYLGTPWSPHWQGRIWAATRVADQIHAPWVTADTLLHPVGVAIHTSLIASMLDWIQDLDDPIDEAITDWCLAHAQRVSYCWPSIINAPAPAKRAIPHGHWSKTQVEM